MTTTAEGAGATERGGRWQSRPRLAVALRGAIVLGPVAVSVAAGLVVARLVGDRPLWQFLLVVGSVCVATALLVERVARRFLPLEALLRMTMLFPERAPSRLAVARLGRDRAEQRRLLTSDPGSGDVAQVMLALITALGRHDKRTRGHSERVRMITELLADQLALPQADRDRLRWAALLHDVGKLEVPASIITKPSRLDAEEWEVVRQHPTHGARLAGPFLDWLGEWAGGIVHHHEHFDGRGYPAGLTGEGISRAGRIVAVVDAFETMTAARAYKKAGGTRAALTELTRCSGTQFDPAVVRQFLCIPVPRLWWATGPLGLLVQVPVIGSAQQSALQVGAAVSTSAGSTVAAAGTTVAAAGTAAVVGVGATLGVAAVAPPPAAAETVQLVVASVGGERGGPGAPGSSAAVGADGMNGSVGAVADVRSVPAQRAPGTSGAPGTRGPGTTGTAGTGAPSTSGKDVSGKAVGSSGTGGRATAGTGTSTKGTSTKGTSTKGTSTKGTDTKGTDTTRTEDRATGPGGPGAAPSARPSTRVPGTAGRPDAPGTPAAPAPAPPAAPAPAPGPVAPAPPATPAPAPQPVRAPAPPASRPAPAPAPPAAPAPAPPAAVPAPPAAPGPPSPPKGQGGAQPGASAQPTGSGQAAGTRGAAGADQAAAPAPRAALEGPPGRP